MKKNILIITQKVDINDPVLGFFHQWIVEFSKRVEHVYVICLEKGQYDLPKNVKVFSLGKEDGVSKIKYTLNFYKYIWNLRKKYDSVFVHMNQEYVLLGGIFWRIFGKKFGFWYSHKSVSLKLVVAEILSNIIFSASKESFRLKSNKLFVAGHGIDLNMFSNINNESNHNRLLFLGRISPIKDLETSILALRNLRGAGLDFNLDIIGSTSGVEDLRYLNKIKELVKSLGLSESVRFLGPVRNIDLPKILKSYFAMTHTSNTGSLDKVVLECMLSEVFVFSSNDSTKSILKDYPNLLFKSGDHSSLSKKIQLLSQMDPEFRQDILLKCKKIVSDDHGLEGLIVKILKKYD
jgi:glycosyltransferase involved in cell wall biosynthesis